MSTPWWGPRHRFLFLIRNLRKMSEKLSETQQLVVYIAKQDTPTVSLETSIAFKFK